MTASPPTTQADRTNADWLAALRANDDEREQALTALRQILIRGLRRGLVNWVNTSGPEFEPLAEDFVQEALLKILASLDTFRGESQFTTWAHKIAVRVALNELRRKRWQDFSLEGLQDATLGGLATGQQFATLRLTRVRWQNRTKWSHELCASFRLN